MWISNINNWTLVIVAVISGLAALPRESSSTFWAARLATHLLYQVKNTVFSTLKRSFELRHIAEIDICSRSDI